MTRLPDHERNAQLDLRQAITHAQAAAHHSLEAGYGTEVVATLADALKLLAHALAVAEGRT